MKIPPAVAGLLGLVGLALCLEAVVDAGVVSQFVVPRPSEVVIAIGELWADGDLLSAFITTLLEAVIATGLAAAIAVAAGYALWRYERFGAAYYGWMAALFAAPTVLLYPLFLVFFGRSYLTVVVMAMITATIPMTLHVVDGLRRVPRTLVQVGRSFNLTHGQMFRKVQIPAAAPTIFAGFRLGLIYGLVNVIGMEFLIVFGGLGRLVSDMYDRFNFPAMYAAILFIILISFLLFWALQRAQKAVQAW